MRHADIRNTINVYEPNMDESKRHGHCKLVCLVCGNNSWIHDLMLRLAAGRGKIEPWEATSHLESFILKMRNVPPTELASRVGAGIVPGASPEQRRFTPQGK